MIRTLTYVWFVLCFISIILIKRRPTGGQNRMRQWDILHTPELAQKPSIRDIET